VVGSAMGFSCLWRSRIWMMRYPLRYEIWALRDSILGSDGVAGARCAFETLFTSSVDFGSLAIHHGEHIEKLF
jgi:hypothetical protein